MMRSLAENETKAQSDQDALLELSSGDRILSRLDFGPNFCVFANSWELV